jgi:hypothetical protein
MNHSTEIILEVLNTFVSTKFEGIEYYDVLFEKHDDTGEDCIVIDVVFDIKAYNILSHNYSSFYGLDCKISNHVVDTIKRYLSFPKVIAEIYVIEP